MPAKPILFGIDLAAFGFAIVKLLVDLVGLPKKWADVLRAVFLAAGVLVVNLYGMGYISGEIEPWFVLVANVLAVFLIALGYMPELTGLLAALVDRAKQKAYMAALKLVVSPGEAEGGTSNAQLQALRLAKRYHVLRLLDK